MDHSPEGKAGKRPEFFQILAAENVADSLIGIQQFFAFINLVNKEAARHMFAKLFDDGETLFV
jgi:hypothetical protein